LMICFLHHQPPPSSASCDRGKSHSQFKSFPLLYSFPPFSSFSRSLSPSKSLVCVRRQSHTHAQLEDELRDCVCVCANSPALTSPQHHSKVRAGESYRAFTILRKGFFLTQHGALYTGALEAATSSGSRPVCCWFRFRNISTARHRLPDHRDRTLNTQSVSVSVSHVLPPRPAVRD